MTDVTITLPLAAYLDLKNTLIWAALWDAERNNDKNRRVYDNILPHVLFSGPDGTPTPEEREACIAQYRAERDAAIMDRR